MASLRSGISSQTHLKHKSGANTDDGSHALFFTLDSQTLEKKNLHYSTQRAQGKREASLGNRPCARGLAASAPDKRAAAQARGDADEGAGRAEGERHMPARPEA